LVRAQRDNIGTVPVVNPAVPAPNDDDVMDISRRRGRRTPTTSTDVIKLPDIPRAQQNPIGGPSPSHGIAVTSDQKTLLVNSRLNSTLYAYSLPDLTLLGGAALGGKGAGWLTITPGDKTAYVANEHTNNVSAVDIKTLKEVALIPVGFAPARNIVWMAP